MFGLFKRKPKPITREERLAKGWRNCNYCHGHGVYHNGYVRLGCHRCLNGLTTTERETTAQEWETHCALNRPYGRMSPAQVVENRLVADAIMERYRAARAHDYDVDYFRC